jgi:hypothetical protein
VKKHHPTWLVLAALGAGVSSFLAVAGCTRVGAEIASMTSSRHATFQRERPSAFGSFQLANGALPRLGFAAVSVGELPDGDKPLAMNGLCPPDMATIDDRFCVDKYEGSLVEVLPNGEERAWPYYMPVDKLDQGHYVRAVSEKGVYPQGYISGKQAAAACKASGKRLCKPTEWKTACRGPEKTLYPYGNERKPGACNDQGRSPMVALHYTEFMQGIAFSSHVLLNDPQMNQVPKTLAETGAKETCTNGYGVHDMVGNIHEWVDDWQGTFQGGYYLDVTQNGEGCNYRTDAHEYQYHDYSTGFRCCADVGQ